MGLQAPHHKLCISLLYTHHNLKVVSINDTINQTINQSIHLAVNIVEERVLVGFECDHCLFDFIEAVFRNVMCLHVAVSAVCQ
jgi:hypothetical protein